MSLFDRFKRIPDPVEGTAQVVSATGAPDGHGSAACGMHLVLTIPGVPAFAVQGTYLVKMAKWRRPAWCCRSWRPARTRDGSRSAGIRCRPAGSPARRRPPGSPRR
ncbi:hypothetical protein ACFQ1L_19160 [Phytohabitans flavus]|uniref:hypothetical protein n=1 Tax=Phytohabitans flavus TaxID=1076124 RepID=UPI0036351976